MTGAPRSRGVVVLRGKVLTTGRVGGGVGSQTANNPSITTPTGRPAVAPVLSVKGGDEGIGKNGHACEGTHETIHNYTR